MPRNWEILRFTGFFCQLMAGGFALLLFPKWILIYSFLNLSIS
ncbi:hypothetical protein LINPERPRIM_LOCUS11252 [Linum perenne]